MADNEKTTEIVAEESVKETKRAEWIKPVMDRTPLRDATHEHIHHGGASFCS